MPERLKGSRIIFRVDASLTIGTGHVMRCLTLANELAERGASCHFICRAHPGHLLDVIRKHGHAATQLSTPDFTPNTDLPPALAHAHWLGTSWQADAADTLSALGSEAHDWLIVDHYALDHQWEKVLRPVCKRLMVIDDLADRRHDCDLLLDQNYGRLASDYVDCAPSNATVLAGPSYALLRPEFPRSRAASLARRRAPRLEHLLITMGGVDRDNATGRVLDALMACRLPHDLRITIVLGSTNPWIAQLRSQAEGLGRRTRILVGTSQMAQLMVDSDLAIGAAGSTSWERCCLGLPTIQMVLADNQKAIANALAKAGAAWSANEENIQDFLESIFSEDFVLDQLATASQAAAAITAGLGAPHIASLLTEAA